MLFVSRFKEYHTGTSKSNSYELCLNEFAIRDRFRIVICKIYYFISSRKSMQKIQIVLKCRLDSNKLNFVVLIAIFQLIFGTKIVHSSILCKHHLSISNFHQV